MSFYRQCRAFWLSTQWNRKPVDWMILAVIGAVLLGWLASDIIYNFM